MKEKTLIIIWKWPAEFVKTKPREKYGSSYPYFWLIQKKNDTSVDQKGKYYFESCLK